MSKKQKRGRSKSPGPAAQEDTLNSTNPDIFDISPRAGGFIKVLSPKSQDYMSHGSLVSKPKICHCKSKMRYVIIQKILNFARSTFFISSMGSFESDQNLSGKFDQSSLQASRTKIDSNWSVTQIEEPDLVLGISDPVYDTMNLLATTISCVMLLASGVNNMPEDYLIWTEQYLECIKNPDGRHPPNILGILNHIQLLKQSRAGKKKKCSNKTCQSKTKSRNVSGQGSPTPSHQSIRSTASCNQMEQSDAGIRTLTTVKANKKDSRNY